jgi:hypothetical protein
MGEGLQIFFAAKILTHWQEVYFCGNFTDGDGIFLSRYFKTTKQ